MGIFEPDFLSYVILEQSNHFMRNVWYCNFIECQDDLFFLGGQMLPVTIGSDPPLADIQSQFLMQGTHKSLSSAAWMTSRNACRAFLKLQYWWCKLWQTTQCSQKKSDSLFLCLHLLMLQRPVNCSSIFLIDLRCFDPAVYLSSGVVLLSFRVTQLLPNNW